MSVYEKLMNVQVSTHATKEQENNYYKYRHVEQIMHAVKPVLKNNNAAIYLSDELVMVGERYYIKATATFVDLEDGAKVSVSAYAREPLNSKTMGESQITGSTSSYARKYCLCGLLLLDDSKVDDNIIDMDSQEYLDGEGIDPDADKKAKGNTDNKEKQSVNKPAGLPLVKFDNEGKCLVLVATKDGDVHAEITKLPRVFLEKIVNMKQYEKAKKAINVELDERSLRGE